MQPPLLIFEIIAIGFSIIIHEVAHGFMAEKLGDPTARRAGRLTLKPLKLIDPIGSILVPIITSFTHYPFGWAKPVPFNPYNLKNRRSGELLIALAGPASNLLIALVFAVIFRLGASLGYAFLDACVYIIAINVSLAVFNLVPIPPLDGSKILFAAFPTTNKWNNIRVQIERSSFILLIILIVFLWKYISPIIPMIIFFLIGY